MQVTKKYDQPFLSHIIFSNLHKEGLRTMHTTNTKLQAANSDTDIPFIEIFKPLRTACSAISAWGAVSKDGYKSLQDWVVGLFSNEDKIQYPFINDQHNAWSKPPVWPLPWGQSLLFRWYVNLSCHNRSYYLTTWKGISSDFMEMVPITTEVVGYFKNEEIGKLNFPTLAELNQLGNEKSLAKFKRASQLILFFQDCLSTKLMYSLLEASGYDYLVPPIKKCEEITDSILYLATALGKLGK